MSKKCVATLTDDAHFPAGERRLQHGKVRLATSTWEGGRNEPLLPGGVGHTHDLRQDTDDNNDFISIAPQN